MARGSCLVGLVRRVGLRRGCGTDRSVLGVDCFAFLSFCLPVPRMPCPPFLFFFCSKPWLTEHESRWTGRVTQQPCPLVSPSGLVSVKGLGSSPGSLVQPYHRPCATAGRGIELSGVAAEDGMVAFRCQLIWRVGVRDGRLAASPPFSLFCWGFLAVGRRPGGLLLLREGGIASNVARPAAYSDDGEGETDAPYPEGPRGRTSGGICGNGRGWTVVVGCGLCCR